MYITNMVEEERGGGYLSRIFCAAYSSFKAVEK
jgi:hypothetical protein